MSDGGSQDVVPRNQAVFGDITNVCGKRPLSLESEKNDAENKIGRYQGTQRTGFRNADFGRKLREMVEDVTARKVNTGPASEMCENVVDHKGKGVSFDDAKQPCQEGHKRDGTDSVRHTPEMDHGKSSASNFSNLNIVTSKGNNVDGGECLTEDQSEESGLLECLMPFGSLDFKMANMEGFLNANAASNVGSSINDEGSMGSEKSCACSFCLKAAYMWTDLHYQDTRGRLAALKKSKRLARSLEARCYGHDYTSKTARDNSKKSTEIEFELMQRWRSLFLHTENVLVRETAHLAKGTEGELQEKFGGH
ncbi:uncharacterized protein LOC103720314 isoform X2 [Phoenix dactylifera]|uniref:Uncharacterized protein LOC103720314 isoform X2 n=1 Tax=Phoenix dactylifera TaxID=42345 RepID=A0A8B8ZNP5_PHODC|nr:uncharacterized protein LOC103720314 isoform X2 [Phoenix dactylifera]